MLGGLPPSAGRAQPRHHHHLVLPRLCSAHNMNIFIPPLQTLGVNPTPGTPAYPYPYTGGRGFGGVRVRVRVFLPRGYPCHSLILVRVVYVLVSAWGFVWPRAWIGKVRGRRWVPATKRRGKGRYYVARILRVPLEGLTSGIAHKIWGENEVVTELRARTHYSRTR